MCHPDDVVMLHLTASAHAQPAVDAGIKVHCDRRVRVVGFRPLPLGEPAHRLDLHRADPIPELGIRIVTVGLSRLVGKQQLKHQLARFLGTLRGRLDLHAFGHLALARSG